MVDIILNIEAIKKGLNQAQDNNLGNNKAADKAADKVADKVADKDSEYE